MVQSFSCPGKSPSPLSLFSFSCSVLLLLFYYYYYYLLLQYVYLLVKGIITVENKPGPKYSNDQGYKPGYLNSKDTLTFSLSLFPNGHCMCAGYLTHTISPAGLVALHRCRPSHLYNINSLAFSSPSPLSLLPNGQLGSLHYIGAGYLTYIISTALLSPLILLSLSSQMAIVCVQAISRIQYRQLGSLHYIGAGYLTYIISTALLSPLILLSLSSPNGHCMCAG